MQFELSDKAAATIAGLVAETDDLQEITEDEDGLGSEAVTAPDEVWEELHNSFPLSLFKEHGEWVGKDE